MEADFAGSTVVVTLFSPPHAKIRGTVTNISTGQLFLRDVIWLASGHRTISFDIASSNISDLEVLSEEALRELQIQQQSTSAAYHISRPSVSPQQFDSNVSLPTSLRGSLSHHTDPAPTVEAPTSLPTPVNTTFDDPAILSFNRPMMKPSSNTSKPLSPKTERPPIPRQMLAEAIITSPARATPAGPTIPNPMSRRSTGVATAILHEPFDDLSIGHEEESEAAELGTDGGMENIGPGTSLQAVKRARKKGTTAGARNGTDGHLPTHAEEVDMSIITGRKQSQPTRSRATRQPIVSEMSGIEASGPSKSKKKKGRREKAGASVSNKQFKQAGSGWATEDATDIQELGDFDFAGNLSKFNKGEVFKQLRQDDKVAVQDRLVGHNRLPKAGTAGGKNLHWTENVLDSPNVVSSAVAGNKYDSSDSESSDAVVSSERGSRRAASRASRLRTISRKDSGRGAVAEQVHLATGPGSIPTIRSPSFPAPSPKTRASLSSPFGPKSTFTVRLADSGKPTSSLSPLQMLEFEQFAITELGLSEDALTENAARGIAQAGLKAYRATMPASNGAVGYVKPVVVVAVGNHRAGARTLAAARQLRNHGYNVTAAVMGDESGLLDAVKTSASALTKSGGKIVSSEALLSIIKGESPVGSGRTATGGLLIESLLGVHRKFEDLRGEDQAWFFECLGAVRRGTWKVASIDCPSGVDPVSGEITQTDPPSAYPLIFHSSVVISLGAPKPYLTLMQPTSPEPLLYVVDMGIGNVAWKRLGSRRTKGIEWGDSWIKGLEVSAIE